MSEEGLLTACAAPPEPGSEADLFPIRVRGLRNVFGEHVIHDNLDLDVRRGEILGVVGGSGTGKSVLMRSIIGLQIPEAGEIEVLGSPITESESRFRKPLRR